jgi:hypothetical protein
MREFETADTNEAIAFYRSIDDPTARAGLNLLIDHPEQRSTAPRSPGASGSSATAT